MSTGISTLLNAVTATGAGTALDLSAIDGYQGGHTFQVSGITTATVNIEGTIDGTTWHVIGTLTADGMVAFNGAWLKLRGNVTAYTSGTITAKVMYGLLDVNVLTRLTSARAALLDNLSRLDVVVSTRATSASETNITNLLKEYRRDNLRVPGA